MSFHQFAWRGEPIADIAAWAAARHEPMVTVRETRREWAPWGAWVTSVDEIRMPRVFADGLPAYVAQPGLTVQTDIL